MQYFLPLASIANVGKAIALAAFVSTTPAFQQALCNGGNLADLTAKNQVRGGPLMRASSALNHGVSSKAKHCVASGIRLMFVHP
jgi:hypothetical protein